MRVLAIALVLLAAAPVRADSTLHVPYAAREAMAGCWDVGAGERLTLTRKGKHLMTARRGRARAEAVRWDAAAGGAFVSCRPPSRHGSFCVVAPEGRGGQGGLRVRVYRKRHGSGDTGFLAEDLIAVRC